MREWVAILTMLLTACSQGTAPEEPGEAEERIISAIRSGDWTEASNAAKRTLETWPNLPEVQQLKFRLLRAEAHLGARELAQAAVLLQAEIPESEEFARLRVRQQMLRADIPRYRSRAEPDEELGLELRRSAIDLYDKALAEAEELGDSLLRAEIQNRQGQLLIRMGEFATAETALLEALDSAREEEDVYLESLATLNLGYLNLARHHWDKALNWQEQALEAGRKAGSRIVQQVALLDLAISHRRLGHFEECRQRCREMLNWEEAPAFDVAECLGEIANSYVREGRYAESEEHFRSGIAKALELEELHQAGRLAGNFAVALLLQERWEEAEDFNARAMDWKRSQGDVRSLIYQRLTLARIHLGRGEFDRAEVILKTILQDPDLHAQLRWDAMAGLAKISAARRDWDEADRYYRQALAVIERSTDLLQEQIHRIEFFAVLARFYHDYVEMLLQRGKVAEALQVVESSRARVLAERSENAAMLRNGYQAPDYQGAARRSDSVFLSYWLGPERSWLWEVTAQGIDVHEIPNRARIADWVERYQDSVIRERNYSTASKLGQILYERLVSPADIAPGSTVYLVADGPLHGLNFETLVVDGHQPHYWIRDVTLILVPTLDLIAAPSEAEGRADRVLLIGDPEEMPPWGRPPRAAEEILVIIESLQERTHLVLRRAEATPERYLEETMNQGFSFIHFAAHAEANQEKPLESAIILSRSSPLKAFKLYARDILNQGVGADLVTLSACHSAGAKAYSGEGLVGFAWAFLQSGARRVAAGLWEVDGDATFHLMQHFYRQMSREVAPPQALRSAKLRMLDSQNENFRQPFYWGAFQLFVQHPESLNGSQPR
ncbi:MAG TPA: CHAT domain-containing protein [Acidobacteriota bacterium]|nr:CHAT domain-containing protein [Acidobacteriota bacterium]